MLKQSRTRRGFTLVELIIVVVILAILAAVIIPQFGNTSSDAKLAALRTTLQTVRGQLEVYKVQHKDLYPTRTDWVTAMTSKSYDNGTVDNTSGTYGPYIMQAPVNPMDGQSTIAASQDGSGGWAYDNTTGSFKSNDSSVTSSGSTTKNL